MNIKFAVKMCDPYTFEPKCYLMTLVEVDNETKMLTFKDNDGNNKQLTFEQFNKMLPFVHII